MDMYQAAEKTVEPAEAGGLKPQALETKIAEAQPAGPATVPEAQPVSDQTELAAQLPDQRADLPAEADGRINAAVGDGVEKSDKVISGDPEGDKRFTHLQGQNDRGYQGTCGLVSCEGVLRKFGIQVTENDVVEHAAKNQLCTTEGEPGEQGGTNAFERAQILRDFGVPAHAEVGGNLDQLAARVSEGRGVIIGANAGELWQDANYYDNGRSNHAVVVTGVERSPSTGQPTGFYINDSGRGEAGRLVDAATMEDAWVKAGGKWTITDVAKPN